MRKLFTLLMLITLNSVALSQNQQPTSPSGSNDLKREELRKKADALRDKNTREREEIEKKFAPSSETPKTDRTKVGATQSQVCKATIAAIMNQDAKIVNVNSEIKGVSYLSYKRPSDGTDWFNKCKVSGNSVVWATNEGRWRDTSQDEKITYEVNGNLLIIRQKFSDNSMKDNSYILSLL
jgi:hypothetical protein